jgi:hypothetical protein
MASERTKAARAARERMKLAKRNALRPPRAPAPRRKSPPPIEKKIEAPPEEEAVVPATPEVVDYSSMTKSQMQELLKERGITYLPQSTKRILLGLLENA